MQQTWVDLVFRFFVGKRTQVIRLFKLVYILLLFLLFVGGWSIYYQDNNFLFFYTLAMNLGRTANVIYIITLIPGMAKRFGINHKLIALLHIFRRYFGILMYTLVFVHYWLLKGIEIWFKGIFIIPPPTFQIMGILALTLLTPMVLTSTDIAVKKLGIWWWRIHKATYVIIGLIFLHVALQRISVWTILIGVTFVIQIASHLYPRFHQSLDSKIDTNS